MTRSDRVPGYTYVFLTRIPQTAYSGPEYYTWADIFDTVSDFLPGAASKVATITSMILEAAAEPVETKYEIIRNWYEVFDDTGAFIGYYRCEYTVETLVKNSSGSYISISYKSGSMESFYVF